MAIETLAMQSSGSSNSVLLTAPGSNNTKSAYTQLVASSSFAASGIIILPFPVSTSGDFLYDIAVGGSGSESVIISNIPASRQETNAVHSATVFPISIASGSRVAARYQSTGGASSASRFGAYLIAKDAVAFHECTSSVTYGAATGDSGGTSIDPGGSANTKGSYTEITSATSADHQWWVVAAANQTNAARADGGWLVDIAVGGAGSESVVISNLHFYASAVQSNVLPYFYPPIPLVISSGTRIAARAQCQSTDATDRLLDLVLIGFSGTASGGGASPHFSASFMG